MKQSKRATRTTTNAASKHEPTPTDIATKNTVILYAALLRRAAELLAEAHDNHIWDFGDPEQNRIHGELCNYCQLTAEINAVLPAIPKQSKSWIVKAENSSRAIDLLRRVLSWHDYMGTFDAQIWRDIQTFIASNRAQKAGR